MKASKTALVTGPTGGIGGAVTRLFMSNGYQIQALVRSLSKAKEQYGDDNRIRFSDLSMENEATAQQYAQELFQTGIQLDVIFLAAGDMKKDDHEMFAGSVEESKAYNNQANFIIKKNLLEAIIAVYPREMLRHTIVVLLSSQAANFHVGHPFRVNEEGYVYSTRNLSDYGMDLKTRGIFKEVYILEPSLIESNLSRREFPQALAEGKQDAGGSIPTSEEYAERTLKELNLI